MCTAVELKHLVDALDHEQNTGNGRVARVAARIFEEMSNPTLEAGRDLDCFSAVTRALKRAEDNARCQADWFQKTRLTLLGKVPMPSLRQPVAV